MILEILILRYELKGKDMTRPEIFRLVLGPCAQYSPLLKNNGLCTGGEPMGENGEKWGKLPILKCFPHFSLFFPIFLSHFKEN